MTFNHAVLIFVLDNATLFLGYAAFSLYALVIIAIPFRQRERWAWYATWILPLGLAIPAFSDPNITFFYLTVAAAGVVGLLLAMRDFFAIES